MKDFYSFVKDYGIKPLTVGVGTGTLLLFGMTLFHSLSFIPKMLMLFVVMPWVFGH